MSLRTFHVSLKTNRGEVFFDDEELRRLLWSLLSRFKDCGGAVLAFAILGNHAHLLVRVPTEAALSRVMGTLLSTLARVRNQKWGQGGVVWRPRFWRNEVLDDDYLRYLMFYIHANMKPVFSHVSQLDAGLLSSHAVWLRCPPDWLDATAALSAFGGWDAYLRFCEDAVGPRRIRNVRPHLQPALEHALIQFCRTWHIRPETVLSAHRGGAPDRQAGARALHAAGASIGELSSILGTCRRVVARWLGDAGDEPRQRRASP